MKTMTCKQMGGPCMAPIHGDTADDIIKGGEKHIRDMVAKGDMAHKEALKMMDDMRKNPAANMGWYEKFQKDFATLPDD
jgi:polyhydroxyalkanoate synthesis regulator phasin